VTPRENAMPRPRRWVLYFAVLALLGAAAVAVPIVYNLSIQLTPEQVREARQRWEASGPADYELLYQERVDQGPVEVYRVEVRGGQVARVSAVGPDGKGVPLNDLSAEESQAFAVPALLGQIERHLEEDLRGGKRRNFATASFDKKFGHPTRYVRRVKGGERLEWRVRLTQ
jgi:hypothetical protein